MKDKDKTKEQLINELTELRQQIAELEESKAERKQTENILLESEMRFRAVADSTTDLVWEGDVRTNSLNWYGDIDGCLGYNYGDFPRTITGHGDHIHPDDRDFMAKSIEKSLETGEDFNEVYRIRCKDGTYRYWAEFGKAIGFEKGKAVKWVGAVTDITERKKFEEELLEKEKRLEAQAKSIQESNTALKVLLKQRENDKLELENNIINNLKHLIFPYIEKLKQGRKIQDEPDYISIIESNLNEIVSPFASKLSFQYLDFTPKEILVADLIRDGKQDKDIMGILNISLDTIKFHRKNIRRKLGIYGKRANLRTKLLSLDN